MFKDEEKVRGLFTCYLLALGHPFVLSVWNFASINWDSVVRW